MNTAHWHLVLNHFPIIGTIIGLLVMISGIIFKSIHTRITGAALVVLMAVFAIPAFLTGEGAEEIVEGLPGVSETFMEQHEDAASTAMWLMEIAGIASLVFLFAQWKKLSFSNAAFFIALAITISSSVAMAYTGYLGGKIRHSEIRNDTGTNTTGPAESEIEMEEDDD